VKEALQIVAHQDGRG